MTTPDKPTHYAQAEAILAGLPKPDRLDYDLQIAAAQAHATLAVADQLDSLDSTLRDLHETLRGSGR
ncbi:hypothetical protein Drose_05800 [Dactylosporangium roseum]|uniref:Uncharacterized protein n=1 Tax=Dactylosporangium roseum TaxID=47989 RepID=A0ABY5ZBS5_9ACTN|nr:hypothetical protein [Dactylosporangium roseum]UWZ37784.1 hypothetical protein Drose_05800 [Dactylosporangium roseum]